jgi:hypothetical protein
MLEQKEPLHVAVSVEAEKTAEKQRGKPFPPGVSGNPNGRPPKEWTWRSLLLEAAEEMDVDPITGEKVPVKKIMARKLVTKGKEGDVQALKEFGDRVDGKSGQSVDLTSKGEKLEGIVVELVRYETKDSISGEA